MDFITVHLKIVFTLIALSCLSLAIDLGSLKASEYKQSMVCSSVMWIATGGVRDDLELQKSFMGAQKYFDQTYAAIDVGRSLTNGEITSVKSKYAESIGRVYDNRPQAVYEQMVFCQKWMMENMDTYVNAFKKANGNFESFSRQINLGFKPYSGSYTVSSSELREATKLMRNAFYYWDAQNRITPEKLKQQLRNGFDR